MKKELTAGLICAAMAGGAAAFPAAADEGVTVQIQGEASLTVPNDEALVTFSVEAQRPKASEASDAVLKQGNLASEALKRFGGRITVETTISPPGRFMPRLRRARCPCRAHGAPARRSA